MRIFIQVDETRYGDGLDQGSSYYPLESFFRIICGRTNEGWRVMMVPVVSTGHNQIVLVTGLEEDKAKLAMDELLSLTGAPCEGTAVIRWEGEHFARRCV